MFLVRFVFVCWIFVCPYAMKVTHDSSTNESPSSSAKKFYVPNSLLVRKSKLIGELDLEFDLSFQHQFYQKSGEICISKGKVAACSSNMRPLQEKIVWMELVCKPEDNEEFQKLVSEVEKGHSLVMEEYIPTKVEAFLVPRICQDL